MCPMPPREARGPYGYNQLGRGGGEFYLGRNKLFVGCNDRILIKISSFAVQTMDPEVVVVTRYDTAVRTAANFLSVFLGKYRVKKQRGGRLPPSIRKFRLSNLIYSKDTSKGSLIKNFILFSRTC